jgi:hypothetical protein
VRHAVAREVELATRLHTWMQVSANTPPPPQSQLGAPMQRLVRNSSKSPDGNPMVKISANCRSVGI